MVMMKKALYNIFAVISAFFLVSAGMNEPEAMQAIPSYEETGSVK